MNCLDRKQIKYIFQDFFSMRADILKTLNLSFFQVIDYEAPNGKKSVRAKLVSNDKDIQIDFNFLLDDQIVHCSIQSKVNDDSFFVSEYLNFKNKIELRKKLEKKKSEKIDEYLRRYLQLILNLFEKDMNRIIHGKEWTKVPVPGDILAKYK
jgi:hypothetical protein